jgi:hypothetical protein
MPNDNSLQGVKDLIEKYNTEGLTANDMNELAKDWGQFNSSFTKVGELKAGINANTAENIRTALKDLSRQMMPDEATKAIDQETSGLYKTLDRINAQAKAVGNAESNMAATSPAQRIAGKTGQILGKIPKSVLEGGKTFLNAPPGSMNVLQMEKLLPKHLGLLKNLLLK